jgi:hypothetical protein
VLAVKFPARKNREFFRSQQGISGKDQGFEPRNFGFLRLQFGIASEADEDTGVGSATSAMQMPQNQIARPRAGRAINDNRPGGWRDLTMLVSASVLCVSDPCNCYRTRNTSWAKVQRSLEPMSRVISAIRPVSLA